MANDGQIAKDTLFGPERLAARAIDWDRSDRGLSSGRAVTVLHSRRRIHGRNLNYAIFNRKALAPREPSIHGPSDNGERRWAFVSRPSKKPSADTAALRSSTPIVSQFTSTAFTQLLKDRNIEISMDGRGAWKDNVFVERLWRSIKYEEIYLRAYASVPEARAGIGRYLSFYNAKRPHSSLDRQTPDQAYFNALQPIPVAA